jgi:hypothetical protein
MMFEAERDMCDMVLEELEAVDAIEFEEEELPEERVSYTKKGKIKTNKSVQVVIEDGLIESEGILFPKKPGVLFDKDTFIELLTRLADPNIKKGGSQGSDRIWHQIIQDFYYPLVRHVAIRMRANMSSVELDDICSRMYEKTAKFDLSKKSSPLAYFWQVAFTFIRNANTHANNYCVKSSDIKIKEVFSTNSSYLKFQQSIDLNNDYRILEAKQLPSGKYYVIYQPIDPVLYDTSEIEDDLNPQDTMGTIYIQEKDLKNAIKQHAPSPYIGTLALKFYKLLVVDRRTTKQETPTALWNYFVKQYNKGEKIKNAQRTLIVETLKLAIQEIKHDQRN